VDRLGGVTVLELDRGVDRDGVVVFVGCLPIRLKISCERVGLDDDLVLDEGVRLGVGVVLDGLE